MIKIIWKDGYIHGGFPSHWAEIGSVEVYCTPRVGYPNDRWNFSHVTGWEPAIWNGKRFISGKIRKSLEVAKRDCEKMVIQFLVDRGFVVVKELKKTGLLEEVLSEVGIDL